MLIVRSLLRRSCSYISIANAQTCATCRFPTRNPEPRICGRPRMLHFGEILPHPTTEDLDTSTRPIGVASSSITKVYPNASQVLPSDTISQEGPDGPANFQESPTLAETKQPTALPASDEWDYAADEDLLHSMDKRQRERASQESQNVRSTIPSKAVLEDASRHLLKELLQKELTGKSKYKKGLPQESERDFALLQKALDASVLRIKENAKPGYHALPFYIHRDSRRLDQSLLNILKHKSPGIINKVCYNLLVSDAAPSIFTFNLLLRRFTKFRLTSLAQTILTTLFAVGFEPNAHTYAAILQYLIVIGNYDAFGKAVTVMRNSFMDYKNPILASVEMNGWSKFGDFLSMRRRLRLLQEEGLRDHIYVLTVELRYFAKRHMWEGGVPALRALLQKDIEEIDHRALFWAWKLCANCHQHDFIDQLKLLVQEKRWPIEALWTRPSRTRGLPFGYKGREGGQGLKPQNEVRFLAKSEAFVNSEESSLPGAISPTIRVSSTVPSSWYRYSSPMSDHTNSNDVIMESRGAILLRSEKPLESNDIASGSRMASAIDDADSRSNGGSNNEDRTMPSKPRPPMGFSTYSQHNAWKLLIRKRKTSLLGNNREP